ncbi:XRE family transcriptional regulator [Tumebacillus sp. BK434]|uniref:helix-turn-helix domain-containing protein n=1 Tax=Tumebacillus sp. BK434 TaxID=2512169 RepID=UPI0010492CBB|nr:cupin domain-containing protein [Tumebacillus sp. BK434]TCP58098.1 XRE family transcriptional regulator [Tumebacillus sp. BK434]
MDIGAMIREIRKRKNITIPQLCEGTGLSKGFVSNVENNKTSPSIATLQSIANYLQVPLAYFLLEKEHRMHVVRKAEREISMSGKAQLKVEKLAASGGFGLKLLELPPGGATSDQLHSQAGEESYLVLRGRLLAIQGEDRVELTEGDSFCWKSCVPHRVVNIGAEPALLLIAENKPE